MHVILLCFGIVAFIEDGDWSRRNYNWLAIFIGIWKWFLLILRLRGAKIPRATSLRISNHPMIAWILNLKKSELPIQNSHLAWNSRIKFQRNVSWTGCLRINPRGYARESRNICPMGRLCCSTTSEWSSGTLLYDPTNSLANIESLRPFVRAPVSTVACAALHWSLRRKLLIPKWWSMHK